MIIFALLVITVFFTGVWIAGLYAHYLSMWAGPGLPQGEEGLLVALLLFLGWVWSCAFALTIWYYTTLGS